MPVLSVPAPKRRKTYPVRGWSMMPVSDVLLLKIDAAVPPSERPNGVASVQLALTEAQVRRLTEQLFQELAMLRKERPVGSA